VIIEDEGRFFDTRYWYEELETVDEKEISKFL
jgi:hypothetical protein